VVYYFDKMIMPVKPYLYWAVCRARLPVPANFFSVVSPEFAAPRSPRQFAGNANSGDTAKNCLPCQLVHLYSTLRALCQLGADWAVCRAARQIANQNASILNCRAARQWRAARQLSIDAFWHGKFGAGPFILNAVPHANCRAARQNGVPAIK